MFICYLPVPPSTPKRANVCICYCLLQRQDGDIWDAQVKDEESLQEGSFQPDGEKVQASIDGRKEQRPSSLKKLNSQCDSFRVLKKKGDLVKNQSPKFAVRVDKCTKSGHCAAGGSSKDFEFPWSLQGHPRRADSVGLHIVIYVVGKVALQGC